VSKVTNKSTWIHLIYETWHPHSSHLNIVIETEELARNNNASDTFYSASSWSAAKFNCWSSNARCFSNSFSDSSFVSTLSSLLLACPVPLVCGAPFPPDPLLLFSFFLDSFSFSPKDSKELTLYTAWSKYRQNYHDDL